MELLQSRDMTQKELAKALSLPVTTLNGYVRGHREPDYETLQRFADYFGVSCDYLLDYSVNKENQTRLTALSAEEYRFIGAPISVSCWWNRRSLWISRISVARTKRNNLVLGSPLLCQHTGGGFFAEKSGQFDRLRRRARGKSRILYKIKRLPPKIGRNFP